MTGKAVLASILLLLGLSLAPAVAADRWTLIWSDEFSRAGSPDPSKWHQETGYRRNREAQFYTERDRRNARVEKGRLVIEARRRPTSGPPSLAPVYTSASMTSRQSWQHVRIDIRAKLPVGRGTWPALWLLGVDTDTVGWPKAGEIDIVEHVGYAPGKIAATVHNAAFNHVKRTEERGFATIAHPGTRYHVYSLDWRQDRLTVSVDGKPYFIFRNSGAGQAEWPFDRPFYLIMNLAIGGTGGGRLGIDNSSFPQRFLIDYVRVYNFNQRAGLPPVKK